MLIVSTRQAFWAARSCAPFKEKTLFKNVENTALLFYCCVLDVCALHIVRTFTNNVFKTHVHCAVNVRRMSVARKVLQRCYCSVTGVLQ